MSTAKSRSHRVPASLIGLLLAASLLPLPLGAESAGVERSNRSPAGVDSLYRLGPADVLTITVYDHLDLSGDYTIYPDGIVVLPLLGHVSLTGLTTLESTELIRSRLEKDYLHQAVVSLTVKEHRSKKVTIVGGIRKPGAYYLDKPQRLLDILIRADGLTLEGPGAVDQVRITRRNSATSAAAQGPGPVTIHVDLQDLLSGRLPEANVPLRDGDVIYVPQVMEKVHVVGEVLQPGAFSYEQEMTVLKLITLAGGATKKAALRQIRGLRVKGGEVVQIGLALGDPVTPDDIIEVPTTFW